LSWSKPKADYKDWIKAINGLEHLEKPLAEGQGVMLLSAHFTTLEFAGFLLSNHFDFSVTYRPQKNPLFEAKMVEGRSRNYQQAIAKQEIKTFIRCLKKGEIVWYAPDQAYRRKGKVQVTFFDHPCWVPNAILQLARMGDAKVVPFFSHRTPEGYVLDILEPMDLSEKSDTEITQHYHHLIEDYARKHPEQYLWTHRKYKGFE
jgi:KDO2-lipid IV(A) lauroyltransferase